LDRDHFSNSLSTRTHVKTASTACAALILALALHPYALAGPEADGARPFGAETFESLDLVLPDHLPEAFNVAVRYEGRDQVLRLERTSLRSQRVQVIVQGAGGRLVPCAAPFARIYRGTVEGEPGSLVAASLLTDGLHARVLRPHGSGWSVRPLSGIAVGTPRARHAVFASEGDAAFRCGAAVCEDAEGVEAPHGGPAGGAADGFGAGACTLTVAGIAYDSDYEFYDRVCSRNMDTCVALIEDGLNATNLIYERDVKITHRLTAVLVRTEPATDFYAQFPDASDFGAMLSAFRSEWNANHQDIDYDMAYFMTGKSSPEYLGLAYVGTVCTSSRYGMGVGQFGYDGILRHELGHNWGCSHSCGDESRYIMCGNSIDAFSRFNVAVISSFRDSRSCLDEEPNTSPPSPPYVRPQTAYAVAGEGPLVFDVLGFATDANCEPLVVEGLGARSSLGASLEPIDAGNAGPLEALLYSPRSRTSGRDLLQYSISDGISAVEGFVAVEVLPRGLVAYWKLDETSGTTATDASGYGRDGALEGSLSFATHAVPGRHGGALRFDGTDGNYVETGHHPSLHLARSLTVAAWFRVDAFANDGETLVSKGGSAWRLKRDGTRNALKFTTSGVAGVEVTGNVPVNDSAWHHACGVYDGRTLALYIDGVLDASRPAAGEVARNDSPVRIGDELWNGAIDEVRLYNHALSAVDVLALFEGRRVENPAPADGGTRVHPGSELSWVPAPLGRQHDVYLGTDPCAVAEAETSSPEYRGRRAQASFAAPLARETAYWWRVDEVLDGEVVRGEVWSFSTSFAYTSFDEPPLNARSYTPGANAQELGFQTTGAPTDGADPFAGVVETGSTPTTPIFSHRSFDAVTTFAPVDLRGRSPAAFSMLVQARDTGYEAEDFLSVRLRSGAETLDVLDLTGATGLSQFSALGYGLLTVEVPAHWPDATLVLASSSDSSQGSERYDFDSVGFTRPQGGRLLAGTRFAEPAVGARSYSPGAGAAELGFATTTTSTSGASPFVGVAEAVAPSGARLRRLSHRSLGATTTFDAVALRGEAGVRAFTVLRVLDTGYEAEDFLRVFATDGTERADLVRVDGDSGLDDLAGEGYITYGAELPPNWTQASLVVSTSSNSSQAAEGYDVAAVELVSAPAGADCEVGSGPSFRRGDANADGVLDLSDGVRILNFLFSGSAAVGCLDAADSNDSGGLDLSDAVRIFAFLFLGGEAPPAPGHLTCGEDPSADELDCAETHRCG
jgi:hypothetical protein